MKGFLILLMLFTFNAIAFAQTACDSNGYPALLDKYWKIKQQFETYYIAEDLDKDGNLTGDGIGIWDSVKMQYTKAGYSIPAHTLKVFKRADDDDDIDYIDYGNNNERVICHTAAQPGVDNELAWQGDATYHLGRLFATLSMEYHLLQGNGQYQQAQKTLHQLFLALQAYRRLDMTANRLAQLYCEECDQDGMPISIASRCGPYQNIVDSSGYSGFFLRDDIPQDGHKIFDSVNFPDDRRVGGVHGLFSCIQQDLPCSMRDNLYLFGGQDQIIGLLYGLSFVKKYIPPDLTVRVNDKSYNLLFIAQQIAYGMVSRVRAHPGQRIAFPPCKIDIQDKSSNCMSDDGDFGKKLPNKVGGNASVIIVGMIEVLDFIYPGHGLKSKFSERVFYNASVSFYANTVFPGNNKNDNLRMLMEMNTAAHRDYPAGFDKRMLENNLFLMQFLANKILHNSPISDPPLAQMEDILCSLDCIGPCITNPDDDTNPAINSNQVGADYECSIYWNETNPIPFYENGWCSGDRWVKGYKQIYECRNIPAQSMRGNGLDYLIAYNVFHIAAQQGGYNIIEGYYNPEKIEQGQSEVKAVIKIEGENIILENQTNRYQLNINSELSDASLVDWTVSENLEIISIDSTAKIVEIKNTQNISCASGWVEASVNNLSKKGSSGCGLSPSVRMPVTLGKTDYEIAVFTDGCTGKLSLHSCNNNIDIASIYKIKSVSAIPMFGSRIGFEASESIVYFDVLKAELPVVNIMAKIIVQEIGFSTNEYVEFIRVNLANCDLETN